MWRVLVVGSGGAGKSTFARELGARRGLPVVHLDRLYRRPPWTETPPDEWQEVVQSVVADERWVIDGNYSGTLELRLGAADTAILLDVPRGAAEARAFLDRAAGAAVSGRPTVSIAGE